MNYGAITEPINPSAATHLAPRVTMSDDLYRELAEKLRIEAENVDIYYCHSTKTSDGVMVSAKIQVEAERDEVIYTVDASTIVHFYIDKSPCGRELASLKEITFLWIEVTAITEFDGEAITDFDIKKFKSLFEKTN